jgi:polygalacturonase
MLRLRSNLTLEIDPGATLLGTQDPADYPDVTPPTLNSQLSNCRKALVYGEGLQDVTLTGGGKIDGNGAKPEWMAGGVKERTRPMAVFFVLSQGVTIDGIAIERSAMWTLVAMETDDLAIRGVTIHSEQGPTRDGIDIVDCHHALVENVSVYSEDDAICLKSGVARGVQDVTVRDSHVVRSLVAQGLKLGTASTGSFTDVRFENIAIDSVDKAAMAVESVDGADIANIVFDHITFQSAGSAFFVILGKRGSPARIGSIDGVAFRNVRGNQIRHPWGSPISGTVLDGRRYAPKGITFDGVQVQSAGGLAAVPAEPPEYDGRYPDPNLWGNLPASGIFFRHVDGIEMKGTTFREAKPDARRPFVAIDAQGSAIPQ